MNQDNYTVGDLFEMSACISKEVLLEYVHGRLSKPMLRKVEMHMIDCPLCSDAVEGLALTTPAAFDKMLANVNARVEAHQEEGHNASDDDKVIEFRPNIVAPAATKRRSFLPMIGIAASVAILAVLAILFLGGNGAGSIADRHFQDISLDDTRGIEEDEKTAYDEAAKSYKAQDFATAAEGFGKLKSANALYHAGLSLYHLEKFEDAAKKFEQVIKMEDTWKEYAEYNLAITYLQLDRVADAKQLLNAIVAMPNHNFYTPAVDALEDLKGL